MGELDMIATFFDGFAESALLFSVVEEMFDRLPSRPELRATKSQIAVRRHGHPFAWIWIPARYLAGDTAPLVLSVDLPRRDESPRWKEIVEPSPGRYMHHLEIVNASEVDEHVFGWLSEAWQDAGRCD